MMVSIGHENYVDGDKILAVVEPDSAPVKRLRRESAEKGCLIDSTCGRKTRSVIVMATNHVVLCALAPSTLRERLDSIDRKHGKSKSTFLRQISEEDAKGLED